MPCSGFRWRWWFWLVLAGLGVLGDETQTLSHFISLGCCFVMMYMSGISHELRTPLKSIIGYAQSLQPQLADWLRRKPAVNDQVALKGLEYALSVRLLSHQSNGDYLFKLVDEQRGTGPALLQAQLDLTARAAEALYWIANAKTNKDIGEILGMSPRTVNKHLEQVYPALGVENRTAAAGVALRIMVRE